MAGVTRAAGRGIGSARAGAGATGWTCAGGWRIGSAARDMGGVVIAGARGGAAAGGCGALAGACVVARTEGDAAGV